jgi:hypothetical protein
MPMHPHWWFVGALSLDGLLGGGYWHDKNQGSKIMAGFIHRDEYIQQWIHMSPCYVTGLNKVCVVHVVWKGAKGEMFIIIIRNL